MTTPASHPTRPSMLGAEAPKAAHATHVAELATLVAVQPEATVSRTVLKEEGVRIVMFAFDAGQILSEHTAAVPVLLQVLSGRLTVTADGRTQELVPGAVMHLGTRLPHAVEALEPSVMALVMLDPR